MTIFGLVDDWNHVQRALNVSKSSRNSGVNVPVAWELVGTTSNTKEEFFFFGSKLSCSSNFSMVTLRNSVKLLGNKRNMVSLASRN